MSLKQEIIAYRETLQADAEKILVSARYALADHQADWACCCQRYAVTIPSVTQETHSQLPDGAMKPLYVRMLLRAYQQHHKQINEQYYVQVDAMNDVGEAVDLEQKLDANERFLLELVENFTTKYVVSLRPKLTAAGIFGNAMVSTKGLEQVGAGAATKKCQTCGAPRPSGTNLKICDYCGGDFK